ncbi:16341_t:CDS:1, partial [Funneliformis geosporum]
SKAKIIADEKGINLVTASSEFHRSQMIAEYSQNPKQYINDDENIIESNNHYQEKMKY